MQEFEAYTDTIKYEIDKTSVYMGLICSRIFDSFDFGITVEQFYVLDAIYHNPNICQRDVAKILLKDRSNAGRLIAILEEKGLVSRKLDTKGKQVVKRVNLTAEGNEMFGRIMPILKKFYSEKLVDLSSEEMDELRRLLRKALDILSKNTPMQI